MLNICMGPGMQFTVYSSVEHAPLQFLKTLTHFNGACKNLSLTSSNFLPSLMSAWWHLSNQCLLWLPCKQNTVLFLFCVALDGVHGCKQASHVSYLAALHQRTLPPYFVCFRLGHALQSCVCFHSLAVCICLKVFKALFHFSANVDNI